jgi:hypothetical protein
MNLHQTGPKRPTLTLPFGKTRRTEAPRGADTLSGHELRRIVTAMIG